MALTSMSPAVAGSARAYQPRMPDASAAEAASYALDLGVARPRYINIDFARMRLESDGFGILAFGDDAERHRRCLQRIAALGGRLTTADADGFAYLRHPFRHMERFRAYEREARASGAGLWGTDTGRELKATGRRTRG